MDPEIKNKLDEYNTFCADTIDEISTENKELKDQLASLEKKYKKLDTEFKTIRKFHL